MSCSPHSALYFYLMGLLDIGSSMISAIGNSVNSISQNKRNESIMAEQNKFNANEAAKARRETSVASQIQQMKANGINAAANGSTPVSQGSPSAVGSQPIPNVGIGVNDLGLMASQIALNQSQSEKIESETTGQDIENKFKADLMQGEIDKNNVTIRGLTFDVDHMKPEQLKQVMSQTNQLNASAASLSKSLEVMSSQIRNYDEDTLSKQLSNYFDNATLQARIRSVGLDNKYKEELINQTKMLITKGYAEIPLIQSETNASSMEAMNLGLTYANGKLDFDLRSANYASEKETAENEAKYNKDKSKLDEEWVTIDKYLEKGVEIVDIVTGCASTIAAYHNAKSFGKMAGAAEKNAAVNSQRLDFDWYKVDNPTSRKRRRR